MGENGVCGRATAAHQNDEEKDRRHTERKQAPLPEMAPCRCSLVAHGSNPAENHQNDHNEKDQPHTTGGVITPVPTVRPTWQRAQKRQNQNHNNMVPSMFFSFFLRWGRSASRKRPRPSFTVNRGYIVTLSIRFTPG